MPKIKAALQLAILLPFIVHSAFGQMRTDSFSFVNEGKRLYGILDLPADQRVNSIVLIIQGYGKSDVVAGNWFHDLRSHFAQLGLACYIWDKPGCGKSEGNFDINQSVQSSAKEALAAIEELKQRHIAGSDKIGLWGISRAGWICPLIVEEYPSIVFWISVSGTDDKENFGYLLESNFRIEGRNEAQTQMLMSEWRKGSDIFRKGGTFNEYQKATQNLRQDTFWISVSGDPYTLEGFVRNQKKFINDHHEFDEKTGLMIYVTNFQEILNKIKCPVLAIFGEKDANVDWRKTMALYKETIGKNANSKLTVKSLPNCNHNIIKCKTGGYHEHIEAWQPCDGYFDIISTWIKENGFGK
jgi:alpha-beta hydrolase superfamily lysophospholipase